MKTKKSISKTLLEMGIGSEITVSANDIMNARSTISYLKNKYPAMTWVSRKVGKEFIITKNIKKY